MRKARPEEAWAWCARGHRHWGLKGGAGLFLSHVDDHGGQWVLLQHRARKTQHADTWGLLGGARRAGDTTAMAARREAEEESTIGQLSVALTLVDGLPQVLRDDHGRWAYTTVLATSDSMPVIRPRGPESTAIRWVLADEVEQLVLHPGFRAAWPRLRQMSADLRAAESG